MILNDFKQKINDNSFSSLFNKLYGFSEKALSYQKERYLCALDCFQNIYPRRNDVHMFSASGRCEIGGNHTDHQRGVVLAGAVNLDIVAVVSFHDDNIIRVHSEGYDPFEICVDDISPESETNKTALLIKGILSKFIEKGVLVGGFDMYCTSDVVGGGGLSSSAAFETLICTIFNEYYNNSAMSAFEIAKTGHFAENVYFGKKCGLLDQTVSSFGGLVCIDFKDTENPDVQKIDFDFYKNGYSICITDTKSSHEDLTDDYDAITDDMKKVADFFDCDVLSQVDETAFYENLPSLRQSCHDRAILRAIHFFDETRRAKLEAEALCKKDINTFLSLVNESGNSSCELLQNLYSIKNPTHQEVPLAIALGKKFLGTRGAIRVHGGGFGGTIEAFVPNDLADEYVKSMEKVFGNGSCHIVNIRFAGGVEIK